jgi:hypothetical protein
VRITAQQIFNCVLIRLIKDLFKHPLIFVVISSVILWVSYLFVFLVS